VFPAGAAKPVGPYSPAILAGEYLYVAGQGALDASGRMPATVEEQTRVTLNNLKSILEAAGLKMENIVYSHVYLTDMAALETADRIWREFFPTNPPARAVVGVARMPVNTPVEINAVAVRGRRHQLGYAGDKEDLVRTPAMGSEERLFVSAALGRNPRTGEVPADPGTQVQLALDNLRKTLDVGGLDFRHLVFVNPYLTDKMPMEVMNQVYAKHFEFGNTPARATIRVASLPHGANIAFTGVAVRDLNQRRAVRPKNMPPSPTASPCVFASDTLYCSAKSGFIPGPNSGIYAETVENQVRQTMRNLLDGLEEAGMDFSNVVATNVYLDNMDEFAKMNGIYRLFLKEPYPARTTVQPVAPVERKADVEGRWPKLEEISLIAVK
jgi:2-iminobutanoate/2-iminopropanoate deaminase